MCGIYGYSGSQNASAIVVNGLQRLEYRGYDSWGIAVLNNDGLHLIKDVGLVNAKKASVLPKSTIGIGHTRWATHGAVTVQNAHPHFSTDKSFALAQNGIVENFEKLKSTLLQKGYRFISQTDTEVIVRLIEDELTKVHDLRTAVQRSFKKLTGRNTIIVLSKSGDMIAARNGSPLVVGKSKDNEIYISSDVLSFAPYVEEIFVMDNMQMVHILGNKIVTFDLNTHATITPHFQQLKIKSTDVNKNGYEHYMLKEIMETPEAIASVLETQLEQYRKLTKLIKQSKHVYTIGSGSAGIAASQIAFYLRKNAKIPATHLIGADAKEYFDLFSKGDVIIAPSQSGETADVLEVLEIAKKKGVNIVTYVNMPGSMMTQMSDISFLANAGPEICVMSTKVFTSQIVWGYVISKMLQGNEKEALQHIKQLVTVMREYLQDKQHLEEIKNLATYLTSKKDIFLLGKYEDAAIIQEGMVKLIEGTYKHAHAIPSGDLKHYAITLMEQGVPVIAVYSKNDGLNDIENAINQVRARGATVIGIGPTKLNDLDKFISLPTLTATQAIMNIIPLQLLAYYLAKELGNSIDKPRHIAKSVTVK